PTLPERGGPGERAPDARDELLRVRGLENVVVAADHESRHAVERLPANAGDEDDREDLAELFPERAADLVAGHSIEHDPEDDEGGRLRVRQAERLLSRRRLTDRIAGQDEGPRTLLTPGGVTVDD